MQEKGKHSMKKRTLFASTLVALAFLMVTLFTTSPVKTSSLAISHVISPTVGLNFGTLIPKSSQTLPLAITNRYSQTMDWTADTGGTIWLTLDRNKGNLQPHEQQTIYLTANTSSLPLGDYTATLTFTQEVSGTMSTSTQVPVTLHVSRIPYGDDGPHAPVVNPTRFDFNTQQVSGKLVITNTNAVQVNWTMDTGGVNWVTLSTSNGTLQAGWQATVNVMIDTSLLPHQAGTYNTDLKVTFTFSQGGASTSTLVPVTMTVP